MLRWLIFFIKFELQNSFPHSWSIGYDGSPVYFLDNSTVCFLNGNCVKFINIENGGASYLPTPGDGINNLTVNSSYGFIAFSEDGIDARIFVYDSKDLTAPNVILKGTCLYVYKDPHVLIIVLSSFIHWLIASAHCRVTFWDIVEGWARGY